MKTFLHTLAVGTYSRLFEALSSMLSRNTLNPADISIVRPCEGFTLILSWCICSCMNIIPLRMILHQLNTFIFLNC